MSDKPRKKYTGKNKVTPILRQTGPVPRGEVSMATHPDQIRISLIRFDKSGAWGAFYQRKLMNLARIRREQHLLLLDDFDRWLRSTNAESPVKVQSHTIIRMTNLTTLRKPGNFPLVKCIQVLTFLHVHSYKQP